MLILSGGGSNGEPEQLFLKSVNRNKKVLYIPVAWEDETYSYHSCYQWFINTFPELTNCVIMWSELNGKVIDESIGAIFIGGGNTFKLMQEIKCCNFDIQLLRFLENGGMVYGGSAGAIVFGNTIHTADHDDVNSVCLTDFTGMNMLKGKDIWCHYKPSDDLLINVYPTPLIVLYEESGVVVTGKDVQLIGKEYIG